MRVIKNKKGFTLAEVLVATTISGAALAMLMSSFVFILKSHKTDQGKLSINRDIRSFTNELSDNGTEASLFTIYKSFTDRSASGDGASGDFLVLEIRDDTDSSLVKKLVGYYRATSNVSTPGPVQTFELNFSPSSAGPAIDLLPATTSLGTHTEVAELSQGLSDGRLFYNFRSRSIIIRGQLIHDNGILTDVTNTYNFTITPRG